MKLTSRHDIEAPLAFVFAQLADFNGWERAAMRRGADVTRTDSLRQGGPGMTWLTRFRYRGKDRTATIRLDDVGELAHLSLTGMSSLADGFLKIDVMELGGKRTRAHVVLEIKPKTLASRLYVQSLRLARSRVERNFTNRVGQLVTELEHRYRQRRPGLAPGPVPPKSAAG